MYHFVRFLKSRLCLWPTALKTGTPFTSEPENFYNDFGFSAPLSQKPVWRYETDGQTDGRARRVIQPVIGKPHNNDNSTDLACVSVDIFVVLDVVDLRLEIRRRERFWNLFAVLPWRFLVFAVLALGRLQRGRRRKPFRVLMPRLQINIVNYT